MNNYIKSLTGLTDNLITFDPRVAEADRLKIIPANPTARHLFARKNTVNSIFVNLIPMLVQFAVN